MKPSENSIDLNKKLVNRALKLLYKHYNAKHDTDSSLGSFPICVVNFHSRDIADNFLAIVKDVQALHDEFKSYDTQTMLSVTFNSLCRGQFMESENTVNYYLTEVGYRKGMWCSSRIKFAFKYHTSTTVIALATLFA